MTILPHFNSSDHINVVAKSTSHPIPPQNNSIIAIHRLQSIDIVCPQRSLTRRRPTVSLDKGSRSLEKARFIEEVKKSLLKPVEPFEDTESPSRDCSSMSSSEEEPDILEILSRDEFIQEACLKLSRPFLSHNAIQNISILLPQAISQAIYAYISHRETKSPKELLQEVKCLNTTLEEFRPENDTQNDLVIILKKILCKDSNFFVCQINGLEKGNPHIKNLLTHLKLYHEIRDEKDSISLQEQYLEQILEDCITVAAAFQPSKCKGEPQLQKSLRSLYLNAEKKRQYLAALRENLSHPLTEIGVVGEAKLEAVDPLNRGWGIFSTIWQRAYGNITAGNRQAAKNMKVFFREVESISWENFRRSAPQLKTCHVRYLNAEEREEYRVTIVQPPPDHPVIFMKQGKPYDTTDSWAVMQGSGSDIFVFKKGKLFAGRHEIGRLHHSSFYAARRVDCEGEIKCENGQLISLNLQSGHYKPKRNDAKSLLNWLKANGMHLESIPIETVEPIKVPFKVFLQDSSGRCTEKTFEHTSCLLVAYNAHDLCEELNGTGNPAPRTCKIDVEKLEKEILKKLAKKHAKKQFRIQLPASMFYNLEEGKWTFTFESPITPQQPTCSSSSSSAPASSIDSFMEIPLKEETEPPLLEDGYIAQ